MPDTRSSKQEAVLEHISSLLPEANDLVVRISEIVIDPDIDDISLNDSLTECKEMHRNLSSALKDVKDFCSDDDRYRFESSLLQMQITFASLITSLMSTVVARSNRKSKVASDSDGEDQFLQTLKNLVVSSRRPLSEPSVFSGDPLDYAVWKSEFNSFIDEHSVNAAEKIHSLKKYTSGRARECIEGYLCVFSDASYKEARRMLDSRFGDRFVVTFAFREKLEKWPKIADKDHQALQKFSDFLKHIQSNLTELNTVDVLDDPKENYKMLKLLPQWCVNKWADRIETYQEEYGDQYPPFENFVKFVAAQAKRMNNPIIAQVVSKVSLVQSSQSSSTSSKSKASLSTSSNLDSKDSSCLKCGGLHSLQKCDKFAGLSYDDRILFVRENYLCFGCLRSGHQSIDCKSRDKCNVCERRHPTTLHNPNYQTDKQKQDSTDVTQSEEPVVANAVSSKKGSDQEMSSMVVPVWLTHSKVPNRSRLVYALLDSQSDTSFILDQTLNSFSVESTEVELSVSTMTGLNQNVKSRKCSGFEIRGHNLSEKVQLPTLYSRSEIPNNRNHFPTPSFCRQYSHLDSISSKIQSFSNIEVGLLIGFNCPKASCPLEVLLGPTSLSPYAVRTPLGWSVVGVRSRENRNEIVTNRVSCIEKSTIEVKPMNNENHEGEIGKVPNQNAKKIKEQDEISKEETKIVRIEDVNQQHDDLNKISLPFDGESLLELECNIDLIEKNLQFMKGNEDLKFDFAKNVSSSRKVIQSINHSLVAENVNGDLADTSIAYVWGVASDCLNFVVSPRLSGSVTCHNALSIISSGLDSLGPDLSIALISNTVMCYMEATARVLKDALYWRIKVRLKKTVIRWNPIKGKLTCILMFSGVMFSMVWTRSQRLNNHLWARWRLKYLSEHGQWSNWTPSPPNVQPRFLVMVIDRVRPRNKWKLGRIVSVNISEDGHVRTSRVKMVSNNENKLSSTELDRLIHKLIRLVSTGPIPRQ